MVDLPKVIPNWIDGQECLSISGETFPNLSPADGKKVCDVARSGKADVEKAVSAAKRAHEAWAAQTPVRRGDLLREAALLLRERSDEISRIVAKEAGKPLRDAKGETGAAVEQGLFVAGEGRRFYGKTTTSGVPNRTASVVRQPLGVAGLIVPANTPLPNVAWKAFPALLCGNSVVLKAAEDTPYSAWVFAKLLHEVGIPAGVFNVIQGYGVEAGAPLVESPDVDVVSFTGSVDVGRRINQAASGRLVKVCLELGGKNPLVICDDADLDKAVATTISSAFSNAGQRCAAASRIIVFDAVYDRFRDQLLEATAKLKVGVGDDCDLGPVINERQLGRMLDAITAAAERGGKVIAGGDRLSGKGYDGGSYLAPTILEDVSPTDPFAREELFGPITGLFRVGNFEEALSLANDTDFALTASIHTKNHHRGLVFQQRVQAGVANVNGPTHGSEPHMPFGGLKLSGNGHREAGTEALDVYSEWKTHYTHFDPEAV